MRVKTATAIAGILIALSGCSKSDSEIKDAGCLRRPVTGRPLPPNNTVFHFVKDEPWEFNFFSNSGQRFGFGVLVDGARFKRGDLANGKIGRGDAKTREQDLPLAEALDCFMNENPGYDWKESRGIVNIVPNKSDSVPMRLLAKKVKSFSADEQYLISAVSKLFKQEGLQIGSSNGSLNCMRSVGPPPRKKYSCHNASILDCLNQFVVQGGRYHWQFNYDPEQKSFNANDGCGSIEGGSW